MAEFLRLIQGSDQLQLYPEERAEVQLIRAKIKDEASRAMAGLPPIMIMQ